MKKKNNSHYEIFVFSEQHSRQRQFRISKKSLQVGLSCAAVGLITLIGMSVYLVRDFYQGAAANARVQELEQNADKLLADNDYLWATTSELEKRLGEFKEKTDKLAMMVGMEPAAYEEGIGGPDLFGAPYDDYNRPDLGFLKRGLVTLEEHLSTVEEAFTTKTDMLDATPSVLPARGWVSSGFRYRIDPFTKKKTWHNGIDISCQRGTPVFAPAKGVISFKGYQGGFGNMLEISHGNDLQTRYAHLDRFNVSKGQRVQRGDLIGYVGNTGRSTAPHLHYEIHKEGKGVNPMKYVIHDASGL